MPVANRFVLHWFGVSARAPATPALLAVVAEPADVANVAVAALPLMLPITCEPLMVPVIVLESSTMFNSGSWLLVVLSLLSKVTEMDEPLEGFNRMPLLACAPMTPFW